MEHLFIEGAIGLGKSELVRRAVLPVFSQTGGFFVQRVLLHSQCVGFSINPLADRDSYCLNRSVERIEDAERVFLYAGVNGKWRARKEMFEKHAAACLQKAVAEKKRLILLDEIGGIDRECPVFMEALRQTIAGSVPILGVLKSVQNLQKLERRLEEHPQGKRQHLSSGGLVGMETVVSRPGVKVLELTGKNRGFIEKQVAEFIKVVVKNDERME